jgi:hypothetical protein
MPKGANVLIFAPEPLKFFQLEKYFRVVKRSCFSHRKQIRMCFVQERFQYTKRNWKERVQKKWPLVSFFCSCRVSGIN